MLSNFKLIRRTLIIFCMGLAFLPALSLSASAATGSLQVFLAPQGAIDAGAQWRVDGGAWLNSGYTLGGLSEGDHLLEYKDIAGWNKPANSNVYIYAGKQTTTSGTYVESVGTLRVYINPQEAIDAGAQWRVDGGSWFDSGYTLGGLAEGSHLLEYKDIAGWNKPANSNVYIYAGKQTTTSGTYVESVGTLRVFINPQEAIDAGAQWRVDGGAWLNSGYAQGGLSEGDHLVEYKDIAGWNKPASRYAYIYAGKETTINDTYIWTLGALRVYIEPQEAIDAGAQWKVDGGVWLNSGTTVTNLSVGYHLVEFKPLDGWNAPPSQYISIYAGQTTITTKTYAFANPGRIIVDKVTLPAGSTEQFTFTSSYAGQFILTDAQSPKDSGSLIPGVFSVSETMPAGWDLTSATCISSDGISTYDPANIDLSAGETVTCTFTNTKRGRIIIDKVTIPAGSAEAFTFTPSYSADFTLTDADDPHDSGFILHGWYTVSESVPSGWALTSSNCLSDDGVTVYDPSYIDLSPGETVTCTFTNTQLDTIIVEKQTVPAGSPDTFTFTGDLAGTIGDGGTINMSDLLPGSYTSTETVPQGWRLTDISCDDTDSSGDASSGIATFNVDAGETVRCVFTNTKISSIRIIEDSVPNDAQDFLYTTMGSGVNDFSLDDDADGQLSNEELFSNLLPGAFSVTQGVLAGWAISDVSCTGAVNSAVTTDVQAGTVNIDLAAGEDIVCTFKNTRLGTIVVEKQTLPDAAAGAFTFTGQASGVIGDGETITSENLLPGQYTSTESVPTGWKLTSVACDDADSTGSAASGTATFNVSVGEVVTCTFTNTKLGRIIVDKATVPPGSAEVFTFTPSYGSQFTLTDAQTPHDSGYLEPGTYSVAEAVSTGWGLIGASCVSDDGVSTYDPGSIDLSPGETVTCTFTNGKLSSIRIIKDSIPDDPQDFAFGTTGAGLGGFSLDDDPGSALSNEILFENLSPGSYTITEALTNGWSVNDIVCAGWTDSLISTDVASRSVSIDLAGGEDITCTFKNSKLGKIIVEKQTVPNGSLQPFTFSGDAAGSIRDNESITVGNLPVGTYQATEGFQAGWELTGIACDDADSTGDVATGTATFQVGQGETVKCTFTNKKLGSLKIVKDSVPDDPEDFVFNVSGALNSSFSLDDDDDPTLSNQKLFADLDSGSYSVSEDAVAGWSLAGLSCTGASSSTITYDMANRTADIGLVSGDDITCTFTNTRRGKIIVDKVTVPPGSPQAFTFTPSYGSQFTLTDTQAPKDSGYLDPGMYSVAEAVPPAWVQTGATCASNDGVSTYDPGSIDLSPAETVTCTFTNTKLGSLKIVKDSVPDDPEVFSFTATGTGLADFELDGDADLAVPSSVLFENLGAGSYTVSEGAVSGWSLIGLSCTGALSSTIYYDMASRTVGINLVSGEDITCTYTNSKMGKIIVDKATVPPAAANAFTFTPSYGSQFTLTDAQTPKDSGLLVPGTYSVSEAALSGWALTGATCLSDDGVSTYSPANIQLSAAETVTCTFTNTKLGSLKIVKDSVPDNPEDFSFTTTGTGLSGFSLDDDADGTLPSEKLFTGLLPGSYSVTEGAIAGWSLTGLSCTGASSSAISYDVANRTAGIDLVAGEDIVCTFTNTRLGSIIVDKVTVPPGSPQAFTFTPSYGSQFTLTDAQAPKDSGYLDPGTYSVAEALPPGWVQTGATCLSDDGVSTYSPADIQLSASETVTCTFTNTKIGSIEIIKDSIPDDPQDFSYTATGTGLADFTLDDDAGADSTYQNTVLFENLGDGLYSVTEEPVGGWPLVDITCTGASASVITADEATGSVEIDLVEGEDISCTFTNTKLGRIIVDKVTVPPGAPDAFTFTLDAGQFTLTDVQTPYDSGYLPLGLHSVSESVPGGWNLTGATCLSSDGVSTYSPGDINLSAGETVTCTFTNTELGSILIIEDSEPNDPQDFSYTATGSGLVNFELDDDADGTLPNQKLFADLSPGSYSIAQGGVTGWSLTGLVCSGASGSVVNADKASGQVSIALAAGEDIVCTYTNTKLGSIVVEKQTLPDGAAESFMFTGDASGSIGDNQTITVADLLPGVYDSTEAVPAGWKLTGIACDDADSTGDVASATATFIVAAGETVTCTFTNTKLGSVHIIKDSVPNDPQDFYFNTTGSGLNGFSLDDDADGTLQNEKLFGDLLPGSYGVTEIAAQDWELTGLECTGASASTVTKDIPSGTVSIGLAAGENITCTYTNTKRGKIIVEKQTLPNLAADYFDFIGDATGTIKDDETIVVDYLLPGTYSATEVVPAGWELIGISCDDADSTVDVASATATFNVGLGEAVKCVFTNRKLGSIRIIKDALPDDPQDFSYTATGTGLSNFSLDDDIDAVLSKEKLFNDLHDETYSIVEADVPGWVLTGLSCTGATTSAVSTNMASRTVSINLANGDDIQCIFTNTKLGGIKVVKDSIPDDPQDFAFSATGAGLSAFVLDDDPADATQSNEMLFTGLMPGPYSVDEAETAGWKLMSMICTGANISAVTTDLATGVANINLAPGEVITCTYTNTKRGRIIVDKVTVPSGWAESFTFTPSYGSQFVLSDTQTPHDSGLIVPGTYSVVEEVPVGWMQTDATCSSDDGVSTYSPDSIELSAAETVTCTFTNTKLGGIKIIKDAIPDHAQDFSFSIIGTGLSNTPFLLDDNVDGTLPSEKLFPNLQPGPYTVTEDPVSGWKLADITCSGATNSVITTDLAAGKLYVDLAAAELVICKFTNTQPGTAIIEKQTVPDGRPETFDFTGGISGTIGDNGTITVNNLIPGTYASKEAVPQGWALTSISCTDGDSTGYLPTATVTFNINPAETVKCTFINTKLGSIRIVKDSLPDDPQDFAFTTTGTGLAGFALDDDANGTLSNEKLFANLKPGAYSVTEDVLAGWELTGLSCSGAVNSSVTPDAASASVSIDLAAAEDVVCTFTNTKLGKILVDVVTDPPGAPDAFTFTPSYGGQFTLSDAQPPNDSGFLAAGAFSVSQEVPQGWELTGATCVSDDGVSTYAPDAIDLSVGETVTCTFTNTKHGSIKIIKDSVLDDPQDFAFTATGTGLSGFTLDDDADATNSNEQLFTALLPGSYSVTEAAVGGWQLTDLVCSGETNSTITPDMVSGTVSIDLAAGEDIVCTYTNTKLGSIVVEKQTDPDGAADTFTFTGDAAGSIGDNGTITVSDLLPGVYNSTEAVPLGWELTGIVCDDADSTWDTASATSTFAIDPGEAVKCTFTNTKLGKILVDVVTDPPGAPDEFTFTPSYGGQFTLTDAQPPNDSGFLAAGAFSVSQEVPQGWELTGATCVSDDGVSTYAPDAIDLSVGETVTCTFTNTKHSSIKIIKDAAPDDPQDFAFTAAGAGLAGFTLDDDADAANSNEQLFTALLPGSYSVTEAAVGGWKLTGIVCSGATNSIVNEDPSTGTVSIGLEAGEDIVCTYTNTKLGSIIVEKQTDPDGAADTFTFAGDAAGSIGDNGTITVSDLLPGVYNSTEAVPPGWKLTDIVCDDADSTWDTGSATATFNVEAGETVTCTFTNTKHSSIRIIKDAISDDPQDFAFTAAGAGLAGFTLDDDADATNSNEQLFTALLPGSYSVTEAAVGGWLLTDLVCSGETNSTITPDTASGTVSIDLAAGEDIVCTYTNTKLGSIVVEKQTEPDGAADTFTFTGDASGDIGDNGTITVSDLLPGVYNSTEAVPLGWELTGIVCDDGSTGDIGSATATFNLAAGETVKCTFTNTKRGTIRVIKDAVPDNPQDFAFTATGAGLSGFTLDDDADATNSNEQIFSGLLPGSFSVTEVAVGGWELTDLVCTGAIDSTLNADALTGAVNIDLAAGEDIVCTYTNTKLGSIVVEKQTIPDGAADTFTFTGDASGGIGDNQTIAVYDLLPGVYDSAEAVSLGWELTDITCDDADSTGDTGSATATFNLAAGETVRCVFTNSQYTITPQSKEYGGICIGKASSPQTFTLANGTAAALDVGTVDITGTDAGDFALINDGCSGGAVPANGSCAFDVEFSPNAAGARTATAEVNITDAAGTTLTVSLSGIGTECPAINVSAVLLNEAFTAGMPADWTPTGGWSADNQCGSQIDYPFAAPWAAAESACRGTAADELTSNAFDASACSTASLLFSNQFDSNNSADVAWISVSADDGQTWTDMYEMTTDYGYPVPEWAEHSIDGAAGASQARVRFGRYAAAGTGSWAIDNVWAVCEPAELNLASSVGKASPPEMAMVSSVGKADLHLGAISITGPDASAFGMTGDGCSVQTLAPDDTCVVEVVFTPQSEGAKSATLSIPSDDPDAPSVDVPLNGVGLAMGDMDNNGTLNIVDALLVARYAAGLNVNGFYPEAGDVDCNGEVSIIDALYIASKALGLNVDVWCGLP